MRVCFWSTYRHAGFFHGEPTLTSIVRCPLLVVERRLSRIVAVIQNAASLLYAVSLLAV